MNARTANSLWSAFFLFSSTVAPLQAQWVNVTSNLAGMPSECGNLCLLSTVPGKDKIIAGIAKLGLWQTTDGGGTWTQMGQGADSEDITNRPSEIVYDPKNADIFWESGIYNSFGVYRTDDGGNTFHHLGNARHNDAVALNFADSKRSLLLAGGHEQSRNVSKSTDGGQTWTNIGAALPEGSKFSSNPLIIDATTYVVNASGWGKGAGGIFRTTDGGSTWQQVSSMEANGAPLRASDGSIYWTLMQDRGLIRSVEQGLTWAQVCGANTIKGSRVIELPNGKLAVIGGKHIKISSDKGVTWEAICEALPGSPAGLIYAPARQSFFIWYWDCNDKVLPNAVWRHEYKL